MGGIGIKTGREQWAIAVFNKEANQFFKVGKYVYDAILLEAKTNVGRFRLS